VAPSDGEPIPGGVPAVPPLRAGDVPVSILIDYDGTIAMTDVTDRLIAEFLPADVWTAEDDRMYEAGLMGSREIMEREIALFPPDPEGMTRVAAAQPHDPAFPGFVRRAQAVGIAVEVVSDGFGFFIQPAMAALGLPDMPIATARTTFDGGRPRIAWPNGHPTCFVCGTCKRNRVFAHRDSGRAVVFIGDGESDRYAAGYSDFVFAKRSLVRICREAGWPFGPWSSFADLDSWLDDVIDGWSRGVAPLERREHPPFCGPEAWGPGLTAPPAPFRSG
jgi:2-hydroxy-3-keto-5-methylthiopentenyl-1-phosphate phosphatase